MNAKLNNNFESNGLEERKEIRVLPAFEDQLHAVGLLVNYLHSFSYNVEIDNRKLSVGDRINEAFCENIDIILLVDEEELISGQYSVIYEGRRRKMSADQLIELVVS